MEKEILIDASQEKQTRIAIKSDNGVEAYEYENEQKKQLKGNIYLGKISRIEPSLQAAFVDFGNERHGFLAFNDIQTQYYQIPIADKESILKEEEEIRKQLVEETKDLNVDIQVENHENFENPSDEDDEKEVEATNEELDSHHEELLNDVQKTEDENEYETTDSNSENSEYEKKNKRYSIEKKI